MHHSRIEFSILGVLVSQSKRACACKSMWSSHAVASIPIVARADLAVAHLLRHAPTRPNNNYPVELSSVPPITPSAYRQRALCAYPYDAALVAAFLFLLPRVAASASIRRHPALSLTYQLQPTPDPASPHPTTATLANFPTTPLLPSHSPILNSTRATG